MGKLCDKIVVHYPGVLVGEAMHGRFDVVITSCECDQAYLIPTEADGAHCKAAGAAETIGAQYEAMPGIERLIEDEDGIFVCKRLRAATS